MNKVVINDVAVTLTDEQLKANGLQRIPELEPEAYEEWEPSPDGEAYWVAVSTGKASPERRCPTTEGHYQKHKAIGNVYKTKARATRAVARQQAIVRIRGELRRLEFAGDGYRNCTSSVSLGGELTVIGNYMPSAFIKGFMSTFEAWQKVIETHEKDVRLVLEGG